MKIVLGIPARLGSTRFPGKPLCKILNKSMIEHCYKRSKLSSYATDLFVATCDDEIKSHVKKFNGNVIMTEKNILRPGLRVAEAAKKLNLNDNDIVVVIQGDEPLVHPKMVDLAIQPLIDNNDIFVSNLCAEIDERDLNNPSEIKVVCDLDMNALYFSRSPIPSFMHQEKKTFWWKQVCIMPFRWHFMKKFNDELEPTPLELQESIEMIRAIQYGYKIRMVPTSFINKSVDNENDRLEAEKLMLNDELYLKNIY